MGAKVANFAGCWSRRRQAGRRVEAKGKFAGPAQASPPLHSYFREPLKTPKLRLAAEAKAEFAKNERFAEGA
jgi:hypothetical protein